MDINRVLTQLIAAQSMLHIFQEARKMGEFTCEALKNIPGVNGCCIVLRGEKEVIGTPIDASREVLAWLQNIPDEQAHFEYTAPPIKQVVQLPVQTSGRSFGFIYLDVHDEQAFAPYFSVAWNFANLNGIHLENAWQNEKVKAYQEHLEDLVRERTLELQKSRSQYYDLIETAQDLLWQVDGDGRFVLLNPAWEDLLGYKLDEMIGQKFSRFQETAQAQKDNDEFLRILSGGAAVRYETVYITRDGRPVTLIFNARRYLTDDGKTGTRGSAYDITERKRMETQLREAREQLEERVRERTAELQHSNTQLHKALQIRDAFLATMSHELRTPLTGILGLSDVLLMESYGALSDKQKTALGHIRESGHHLLALINDMLDLSRLESGQFTINKEPCVLQTIINECLKKINPLIEKKELSYKLEINPENPVFLGDPRQITKILLHLLDNAVKFTPRGGQIGISSGLDPESGLLEIVVWDTGIGIHQDDLPRLFQPFVQLDARLAREYPGTGLGLAIVKRLVELHNGSVKILSAAGQGTRVAVSFPAV